MAAPRLSGRLLGDLPPSVAGPAYDRAAVTTGIVHLGLGAFHRAHQAVYTDDRLGAGESAWGIVGMSLRSPDVRDALAPHIIAQIGHREQRLPAHPPDAEFGQSPRRERVRAKYPAEVLLSHRTSLSCLKLAARKC